MPNISRNKDNQAMKFRQLIQCNVRNSFLKKLCTKCGGETSPRLFSEKSKMSISLDQCIKFYTVCFYYMTSWGLSKYNETKLQTSCFHLMLNFLKKIKKCSELVSLPRFPHNFWKKIFFLKLFLLRDQKVVPKT